MPFRRHILSLQMHILRPKKISKSLKFEFEICHEKADDQIK